MKSKKLIITLSSVFVLLVALLFAVVLPIVNSGDDTTTPAPVPLEGEGVLYGSLMTYPQVKEESIESISILNDNGGYSFAKDEELSDFFRHIQRGGLSVSASGISQGFGSSVFLLLRYRFFRRLRKRISSDVSDLCDRYALFFKQNRDHG